VVAICVVLVLVEAVGAFGVPLKVGELGVTSFITSELQPLLELVSEFQV
jgi:hypothetical protein